MINFFEDILIEVTTEFAASCTYRMVYSNVSQQDDKPCDRCEDNEAGLMDISTCRR